MRITLQLPTSKEWGWGLVSGEGHDHTQLWCRNRVTHDHWVSRVAGHLGTTEVYQWTDYRRKQNNPHKLSLNICIECIRLSYIPILVYGLSLQCPNQHLYVNLFQPCFSQYSFFEHIFYIRILFSKLNRNRHLYHWFSWTIIYTLLE